MKNFHDAIDMLQEPFEQLFELLEPCPCCIIADKHISWVADTARKFQIPRIIFDGMSCLTLLCSHNLRISKVHESVPDSKPFILPSLPHRIELTKALLPILFNAGSSELQKFLNRARAAESEAYGVVINSFEELEPRYVDGIRKAKGDKVWCIGPLSLCNKDNLDKAERGNKPAINENQCLMWLDEQKPGSVVYACLESFDCLNSSVNRACFRIGRIETPVCVGYKRRRKGRGDREVGGSVKNDVVLIDVLMLCY
ncbi:hypothetical protein CsSME_00038196 [Camellia sinensis var. sinensis]